MIKKIIILLAIVLILILGWYFIFSKKAQDIKYKTARVERGDIQSSISASGTLNAVTTVLIGTQVSGTIKEIYADFNSIVKKGQVIALIDDVPFVAKVRQAEANLESSKAGVENAKANIENIKAKLMASRSDMDKAKLAVEDAKRNLDRTKKLWDEELVSQKDMDNALYNYDSLSAQLLSLQSIYQSNLAQLSSAEAQHKTSAAQVKQNQAVLDAVSFDLQHTRIISPVNGIVISRNVDVGQTVASSFQTPTLFTIAKDLTKMQVNTNVNESDIGMVFWGQEAIFTVDAYPEYTFKGKVSQIRNAPQIIQNVVTYDSVIEVDNRELKLKPGMTANISLLVAKKEGVLMVANAALRFKPKDKDIEKVQKEPHTKGKKIWVLKGSQVIPVSVKTGISNGTHTEITDGDIKEGSAVVLEYTDKKTAVNKSSSQGIPRSLR